MRILNSWLSDLALDASVPEKLHALHFNEALAQQYFPLGEDIGQTAVLEFAASLESLQRILFIPRLVLFGEMSLRNSLVTSDVYLRYIPSQKLIIRMLPNPSPHLFQILESLRTLHMMGQQYRWEFTKHFKI